MSHLPEAPQVPSTVIVCGDPDRVRKFSELLDSVDFLEQRRCYQVAQGKLGNKLITIASHGIGGPSALICFHELWAMGARTFVRVGTCGAIADSLKIGSVVISATASHVDKWLSDSGTGQTFHASPKLLSGLSEELKKQTFMVSTGPTIESGVFYEDYYNNQYKKHIAEGNLVVDMETATLYRFGTVKGVDVVSCLVVDGNPLKWEEGVYNPRGPEVQNALISSFKSACNIL